MGRADGEARGPGIVGHRKMPFSGPARCSLLLDFIQKLKPLWLEP
jgi:hypothetical protein